MYKKCNKHHICFPNENPWFPCNEEYFHKNKKNKSDGLFSYCKRCNILKSGNWNINNKDNYNARHKEFRKTSKGKKIQSTHSKKQRESGYLIQYRKENKEKINKYTRNKHFNSIHKISANEWKACKEYFNNECAYCGLPINEHYIFFKGKIILGDFHKEHVIHNGSNSLDNCVPSCKSCNSQKWEFSLDEWYNSNNLIYNQIRYNKIIKWINEDYKLFIVI